MTRVCSACKGKKLHPEDKGAIILTECDKAPMCSWCWMLHLKGCEFCSHNMAYGGFISFNASGSMSKDAWETRELFLARQIKDLLTEEGVLGFDATKRLDQVTDIIMRRAENIRDYL